MLEVIGGKCIYLTYFVHLVGIKSRDWLYIYVFCLYSFVQPEGGLIRAETCSCKNFLNKKSDEYLLVLHMGVVFVVIHLEAEFY
jgi:hypothetical protein